MVTRKVLTSGLGLELLGWWSGDLDLKAENWGVLAFKGERWLEKTWLLECYGGV